MSQYCLLFFLFALATLSTRAQETKIYLIQWQKDPNLYIAEESNGQLVVGRRDNSLREFWRFIPVAGQKQVFYIQNTATQRYIQSTNQTPGKQSKVFTGAEPIPFYVAQNPQAQVAGGWSFVSTDVTNYDKPSLSPIGLNKDGGSNNVICYQAGNKNVGSYWLLQESENLYEVRPFVAGQQYRHLIVHEGKALEETTDGTLQWSPITHTDAQVWHFFGKSNATGGYSIVNAQSGRSIESGKRFRVGEEFSTSAKEQTLYYFTSPDDKRLALAGSECFSFRPARSRIALRGRLYDQPCGRKYNAHIQALTLEGDDFPKTLKYPEPGQRISEQYYTLFTRKQATLFRGKAARLNIQLSVTPHEKLQGWVYFDWNADGLFDQRQQLTMGRNIHEVIQVPADARLAQSRMRIRLTINELSGADEEVVGYAWDGMINVVEVPTGISPTPQQRAATSTIIYNLLGHPLQQAEQGINIINGKLSIHP